MASVIRSEALLKNTESPKETCLVCGKIIKIKIKGSVNSDSDCKETLEQLAKLLQVTSSIYNDINFDTLPVPLLCSSCSATVLEAVKLQEAVAVLLDRLKKLAADIKKDFVRSLDRNRNSNVEDLKPLRKRGNGVGQVERIRKRYAQCWTPCKIRVEDCGSLTVPDLTMKSQPGTGVLRTEEELEDLNMDEDFMEHEHEEGDTWEEDPLEIDVKFVGNKTGLSEGTDLNVEQVEREPRFEAEEAADTVDGECQVCGQLFMKRGSLMKHQRMCSNLRERNGGLKPGTCQLCGKVFSRVRHLTRHLNRQTRCNQAANLSKAIQEGKPLEPGFTYHGHRRYRQGQCHRCGKQFSRIYALRAHLQRKIPCDQPHKKPEFHIPKKRQRPPAQCHRCGRMFCRGFALRLHLSKKTPCKALKALTIPQTPASPDGGLKDSNQCTTRRQRVRKTVRRNRSSTTPCIQPENSNGDLPGSKKPGKRIYPRVICHRCGKVFSRPSTLDNHLRKKVPCDSDSPTSGGNSDPVDDQGNSESRFGRNPSKRRRIYHPVTCHRCGRVFGRSTILRIHLHRKIPCEPDSVYLGSGGRTELVQPISPGSGPGRNAELVQPSSLSSGSGGQTELLQPNSDQFVIEHSTQLVYATSSTTSIIPPESTSAVQNPLGQMSFLQELLEPTQVNSQPTEES